MGDHTVTIRCKSDASKQKAFCGLYQLYLDSKENEKRKCKKRKKKKIGLTLS